MSKDSLELRSHGRVIEVDQVCVPRDATRELRKQLRCRQNGITPAGTERSAARLQTFLDFLVHP